MPEIEDQKELDLTEQALAESAIDLTALWRIRQSKDFEMLEKYLEKVVKAARRNLDDYQLEKKFPEHFCWQRIGFFRGQIYFIKALYKLLTKEADPSRVMPNTR
jgi:hypothetical protein